MAAKISKRERMQRLADWVIDPSGSKYGLNDVIPFPFRSGVFERMTERQIKKYCKDLENFNPVKNRQEFDAIWDRAAVDALNNCRPSWWRRAYFYWGKYRWPKR